MVIINTSAVEVSIQAVSPELASENFASVGAVGAGAAGAAAGAGATAAGASSAQPQAMCEFEPTSSNRPASAVVTVRALGPPPCLAFKRIHMTGHSGKSTSR